MPYSDSPSDLNLSHPPNLHLSPAIVYYLRKLLHQNLDRLEPIITQASGDIVDPLSDLNLVIEQLWRDPTVLNAKVKHLEHLSLLHQTLSSATTRHAQQLRQVEREIFQLLGFRQIENQHYRATILLIDDLETELLLLSTALKKHAYRVLTAMDGQRAIAIALQEQPDLIALDIKIPGMNGYDICTQLKQNPKTQDIPVLFMSGIYDAQGKVRAFEVGGVDFISKPFHVEEVLARVNHQLNLRELQKRLEDQNVRVQQELQERRKLEERYRHMIEHSIDGIFQTAPDGHFLTVNPALAEIYGYDSPEELMVSITDIGTQLYIQSGRREGIKTYLQQHGQVLGAESRVRRKDGRKIWISENIRSVKDSRGQLLYYEGTVRDITERRRLESTIYHQRKQTERILQSILPKSIAERLKHSPQTIADSFDEVSVLFADIDNFTAFSSRIPPTEQVKLLNQLFTEFDRLSEQLKLEKIKTIRDVYFVAAGVPEPKADHAEAIAEMALGMQSIAAALQERLGEPLQIRVGISSGPVVAGVLGKTKFTYDLWGDPVNLASRMQSNGLPGRIQVTPEIYARLHDRYCFEPREVMQIQGVGEVMTYWLTGRIA
ncbi:adenylate/guanylate cyclase domain-containing protein [Alkalinema sp. FACHB-956]|uniref:adenylate/guanylate cyclase domain-containing protein n=1 Tax=Alkalinema sp. FACHB-956 TaxID=2692768 RepID=UPI001682E3B9|nr:adenylate/guanylate cyclase domain-containing protein [Alkalinema sp. FACHB-956]MBD2326224.1 response regulator [Alkalinema sp. FACHB-956]